MVLLGLPGIADQKVGAEHRGRLGRANTLDPLEEGIAVAPAAHAAQHRTRGVLQRQVEVGHAGRQHGLDEGLGQVRGVEIQQSDPIDPFGDRLHQRDDRPLPHPLVPAVGGQVLGDEDDLSSAVGVVAERLDLVTPATGRSWVGPDKTSDLRNNRLDRAGPLRPAEARDGTEPAGPVAALGDLDVGPR